MGIVAHPRSFWTGLKFYLFFSLACAPFSATSFAQGGPPAQPPPSAGKSPSTVTFPASQAAPTTNGPIVLSGSTQTTEAPPPFTTNSPVQLQTPVPSFDPTLTNAIPSSPNRGKSGTAPQVHLSNEGPVLKSPGNPSVTNPTTFPTNQFGYQAAETPANIAPSEVVTVVPPTADDKLRKRVEAVFRTSVGNFTVLLQRRYAPRTVENFIELAKGTKEFVDAITGRKVVRPFFNGLIFHRVIKNFIVQGGCPFGTGKGGPGYSITDEFNPSLRHNKAGIVSMANAGQANTNGSQFFITMGPQPDFDDKNTVFGEVTKGMDTVRTINRARVGPTDRPIKRIYIIAVDIVEEK